jgi:hypothetical protein
VLRTLRGGTLGLTTHISSPFFHVHPLPLSDLK